MMGVVRLYVEPAERMPLHLRPDSFVPIIDCSPEQAGELKQRLIRRGYNVLAFQI